MHAFRCLYRWLAAEETTGAAVVRWLIFFAAIALVTVAAANS